METLLDYFMELEMEYLDEVYSIKSYMDGCNNFDQLLTWQSL